MSGKTFLYGCLILALCGGYGCNDSDPSADLIGEDCDPGCTDGQKCQDGTCVDLEPAAKDCDPGCTDGQKCQDGTCVDPEPAAKDCDPGCDEENGEICEGGVCVSVPDEDDPGDPGDGSREEPNIDEVAQILVTPVDGLVTIQGKLNAGFSISLSREPTKDVTIPITSLNENAGKVASQKLVFTSENWNELQQIKIVAGDIILADNPTDYVIEVGPSQSEDSGFDQMEKVEVHVSHYSLSGGNPGDILPGEIKLDKKSADILLKGDAVSLTATFDRKDVTDPCIQITVTNETDDVSVKELVSVQHEECSHAATIKSVVVPNDEKCIAKKLDLARTLKLTASHSSGKTASATIELKPYMPAKLTLTNLSKIRDFKTQGHKKYYNKGDYELGEMDCNYYDAHSIQVMNHDMIINYVEPRMYMYGDSKYGTRASVVAAARFLVTQFPKDIPYASSSLKSTSSLNDDDNAGKLIYNVPTIGNYTWTVRDYNEDRTKVRVYGLNLSKEGYNTYSLNIKDSNIILGREGQKEALPWGCAATNADGSAVTSKDDSNATKTGSDVIAYPENGLCCSGFVSWALHNGRFYLGNFTTQLFARNTSNKMCVDSDGNQLRNNQCKAYLDKTTGVFNGNGKHFDAFEKISQLKEEDFVKVSDLTNNSKFKAGDLLWYGTYTCTKENGSCPTDPVNCKGGSGHVAMILGISRNKDKSINKVYVAEATHPSGNHLAAYTIDKLKETWTNKVTDKTNCKVKDSRLIKMDRVYNYYYNKKKSDSEFTKGLNGEDFNSYKYEELWF